MAHPGDRAGRTRGRPRRGEALHSRPHREHRPRAHLAPTRHQQGTARRGPSSPPRAFVAWVRDQSGRSTARFACRSRTQPGGHRPPSDGGRADTCTRRTRCCRRGPLRGPGRRIGGCARTTPGSRASSEGRPSRPGRPISRRRGAVRTAPRRATRRESPRRSQWPQLAVPTKPTRPRPRTVPVDPVLPGRRPAGTAPGWSTRAVGWPSRYRGSIRTPRPHTEPRQSQAELLAELDGDVLRPPGRVELAPAASATMRSTRSPGRSSSPVPKLRLSAINSVVTPASRQASSMHSCASGEPMVSTARAKTTASSSWHSKKSHASS